MALKRAFKLLNRIYELVRQRGKVWPWKGPFVEKRKNNTPAGGGGGGVAAAASAIAHNDNSTKARIMLQFIWLQAQTVLDVLTH